ncbi:unnamed protein product, partial [Scytosiphon promiscuus]
GSPEIPSSAWAGDVWRVVPCKVAGCTKRPSFGGVGEVKASYCGIHKLEGMALVNRKRRCSEMGCGRQPLYGSDSDRIPLACGAHRTQSMVNVTHRRCAEPGCTIQPVYGFPAEGVSNEDDTGKEKDKFVPKYCAGHKKDGMISQKRSCCAASRCYRRPSFGMPGEKGKFCVEHKVDGMVKAEHSQRVRRVRPQTANGPAGSPLPAPHPNAAGAANGQSAASASATAA